MLAAGTALPLDTAVVRHVGGAAYDPDTGIVNGSAFDRNLKDSDGLSVVQRRILVANDGDDLKAICRVVGCRRKLGSTSVFAEIVVGEALAALAAFAQTISFVADPLTETEQCPANPAHALILGLPFKGEEVGSLTAEYASDRLRTTIRAIHPVVV